jgi:uncharacterized protein YodC (DUF2158 family)
MMTIASINEAEGSAVCLWFDEATLNKEAIPLIVLEHSELFVDEEDEDIEEE